jgi:hypothetical protein
MLLQYVLYRTNNYILLLEIPKERRISVLSDASQVSVEVVEEPPEALNGYSSITYPADDPFGRRSYEGYFVNGERSEDLFQALFDCFV